MKKSLADKIEQYIKALIESSGEGQIEIQRSELAETFCCVPSQVTYVIGTRFTQQDGYISESRRGGKGFVRITRSRLLVDGSFPVDRQYMLSFMNEMLRRELIGEKEYSMLLFIIDHTCAAVTSEQQSELRRLMITALNKYLTSDQQNS